MKTLFYILSAIALVAAGCEDQEFEFVGTVNIDKTYLVDNSGNFDESATIITNEFINLMDIPDDATIGEVNIESLSVNVLALNGNEASSVKITGDLSINGEDIGLFSNYMVNVSDNADSWLSVTGLANDGVQAVKNKFQAFIEGTDYESFTIAASGSSAPTSGSRVHAQVTIRLTTTITYVQDAEVPWFIHGKE